jgi:hypothetical protein
VTLYSYAGPVLEFDKIVTNNWRGQTYAVSEAKARNNLAYQFKREHGKVARSKITLPGKIIVEGDE